MERNPYSELLHLLNQRYHREWERAEALQHRLERIQRSWIWRCAEWCYRVGRRLRRRSEPPLAEVASPYIPPSAAPEPDGLVSIIIPLRDRPELLRNCVRGLYRSSYRRFEIILVDNGSVERRTLRLLDRYGSRPGVEVVSAPEPFNFARLCNQGAKRAAGDFLLFLNNDTEVLARDWLESMLRIAADERVGVAGATLLYPDRTIQHAGLFPRSDGAWVHPYRGCPEDEAGVGGELLRPRAIPAVTAACLMIRRDRFEALHGFDERFPVMYNDVDLCARARRRGWLVVVSPAAKLLHYESLSRGYALDEPPPESVGHPGRT